MNWLDLTLSECDIDGLSLKRTVNANGERVWLATVNVRTIVYNTCAPTPMRAITNIVSLIRTGKAA